MSKTYDFIERLSESMRADEGEQAGDEQLKTILQTIPESTYAVKDTELINVTASKGIRHTVRTGGEYFKQWNGRVVSIENNDTFVAMVESVNGQGDNPKIVRFNRHKVVIVNTELMSEGSPFYWTVGLFRNKNNSLEKVLFALGIRHVGKKTAKILASNYQTIDNIINAGFDSLCAISDIGDIIAQSIVDYFSNEENIELINKLKEYNVNMEYKGVQKQLDDNFDGKTFVLTGTINMAREEAKNLIELKGGKVTGSVTGKTDVVIVGENPGSKYDKAISLNITIWNEQTFLNNLNL